MSEKRRYTTLDGMRGVAALAVLLFHAGPFFGIDIQNGYMAVDLFFVLSGFVVAHAYSDKLKGGESGWWFFKLRLVRFWPFYLVGTALGITHMLGALVFNHQIHALWRNFPSIFAGLLFLPVFGYGPLYPLNPAAWSLLYELVANTIYGFLFLKINLNRLYFLMVISSIVLIGVVIINGSGDIGPLGDPMSVIGGAARVTFSFVTGLIIFFKSGSAVPKMSPFILIFALGTLLLIHVPENYVASYNILFVFLFSPLLVISGSAVEPKSKKVEKIFLLLGVVSYPIYIIHYSLCDLLSALLRHIHLSEQNYVPWGGMVIVFLLFMGSLWLEKNYDRPFRKWLTKG